MGRFSALEFLCKLQVFIGSLFIIGAVSFAAFVIFSGGPALVIVISAGVALLGVQIVAAAQVFQCLMQIEINTRPVESAPLHENLLEVKCLNATVMPN